MAQDKPQLKVQGKIVALFILLPGVDCIDCDGRGSTELFTSKEQCNSCGGVGLVEGNWIGARYAELQ